MIRGGSWFNDPEFLRSSTRFRDIPVYRYVNVGFRLAQDTP
ncbi:MAG: SUMF1/EgtB/PvdO family nonheme iron enzyme [Nitrospirales bacterium]|nr:SUMF1/EgtB/PvdO family nonheme iron enzyme [Nitrospirales bacterium]